MERKREIQSNIGEEITETKPGGFSRSDLPAQVIFRKDAPLFDSDMTIREIESLSEQISTVANSLGNPSVSSVKELNRWLFLEERGDTVGKLQAELHSKRQQILIDSERYTWGYIERMGGFVLGNGLLYHSILQEKMNIAKKNSFDDKYSSLAKLLEFYSAPELSLRIGSVSLLDFQNFNPKTTSPAPYYKYLVEARLMTEDTEQQAFEENNEYPKNLYPNITKFAISALPNTLFSVINLAPETFPAGAKEPILRDGQRLALRFLENVQEVRKKINQTVVDPNSKDFPELSTLVAEHQENEDKSLRTISLYIMNLDTRQRTIEAYRKARKYEREDNNGEFYMIFGDAVGEYIEEASPFMNILTNDDISEMLNSDYEPNEDKDSEPTLENLGKKINDIFNKTSRKDYDIEAEDVNWSGLQIPDGVQIIFDQNRPRRFSVKVNFGNELGESTEVECFLDTTRNTMDWNHPEDPMSLPDNPDLIALKRSMLVAAQSILDNVYRQAQEEYEERHAPQDQVITRERGPKRERYQDPMYQLRKETRAQTQESQSEPDIFSAILSSRQEVKHIVVLPSKEEFEDTARALSHVDQEIVRKSIEEYNEKGTGAKFARKKGQGQEGEPIYGLSIGCTVPKGARILLREIESEPGTRTFEISNIRYRKDIYSKNRL